MNNTSKPIFVLGIKPKLFMLVFFGIGLLIAAIAWQIGSQANKVANKEIAKALKQSSISLDSKIQSRFDAIQETAQNFVRDGRLLPLVYDEDTITLQDLILEFSKSLDFDSLFFTNGQGVVLARSDRPEAIGRQIAGRSALIDQTLAGEASSGFISSKGRLKQIVAVPITDNYAKDLIKGSVALAYKLSPKIADELHDLTNSEIGFFSFNFDRSRQPNGVNYIYVTRDDLQEKLTQYFDGDRSLWSQIYQADSRLYDHDIIIDDEEFKVVIEQVKRQGANGANAGSLGFIVILKSKTELIQPFLDIQQRIIIIGLICLALASLFAWFVAWRMAKPITELVGVSHDIRDGCYERLANEFKKRGDEIGLLQQAIFSMGKSLRDKAELEHYLADLSTSLEDDSIIIEAQNLEGNLSDADVDTAFNTQTDHSVMIDGTSDGEIDESSEHALDKTLEIDHNKTVLGHAPGSLDEPESTSPQATRRVQKVI